MILIMQESLAIAIEGPSADRALDELLAIPGIRGRVEPPTDHGPVRDGGVLAVIGTVVGIVGGVAAIADSIIAWREKWKAKGETQRFSVTIEDAKGNRISLTDATREQITAALQTLIR